ncbi:MAG: sulfatase [Myxococcota bacterium]|nr:sulfatase [Myxococcota bacterium]
MKKLLLGIQGGVIGGALIGVVEALYILSSAGAVSDYVALFYAAVLYGLIGGGMGVAIGVGLVVLSKLWKGMTDAQAWALAFFGASLPLFIVIGRYVANKVIYGEQGVPMTGLLGILGIAGAIFGLGMWLVPVVLNKTPLRILTELKGSAALYGVMLLVSGVFSFAPGGGDSEAIPRVGRDQAAMADKPNVLLIMVDTLRADYLAPYDSKWAGTQPTIEALAADSVVFEQAHANSSWTRASFANVYTSMVPSSHSTALKSSRLPGDVVTLAEVLQEGGYATGGLPNNTNVTSTFGFGQGFDHYPYLAPNMPFWATESVYQLSMYAVLRKVAERAKGDSHDVADFYQPVEVATDEALAFIDAQEGDRWFLMMHLMEPHDPYFEHPYNGVAYGRAEHEVPESEKVDYLKDTYAKEIAYMDGELAAFIEQLKTAGVYDDTLIVFSADHGEEFLEHGGWWHGTTLYEEQTHVPLIVKLPNQEHAGTRAPWIVRHIDVAPTIAQAAGLEAAPSWQGRSVLDGDFVAFTAPAPEPELDEEGNPIPVVREIVDPHSYDRTVLAEEDFEGNQLTAVIQGGWKLIEANEGNPRGLETAELYDLRLDAGEQDNLAASEATQLSALQTVSKMEIAAAKGEAVQAEETEMDAATMEQLRALGYMGE